MDLRSAHRLITAGEQSLPEINAEAGAQNHEFSIQNAEYFAFKCHRNHIETGRSPPHEHNVGAGDDGGVYEGGILQWDFELILNLFTMGFELILN